MLGRPLRWLLPLPLDCGLRRRLCRTLDCDLWWLLRLMLDRGLRRLLRLTCLTLDGRGTGLLRRRLDRYGLLNVYVTRLRRLSAGDGAAAAGGGVLCTRCV